MAQFNMPAIVYLNTGWIEQSESSRKASQPDLGHYPDEKFLIWNEVLQLFNQQWEIGSHGVDHIDLTQHAVDIIIAQLINSKRTLESYLQQECAHFAYTWGKHSKQLRTLVQNSGYRYAVAGNHIDINKNANIYALPRMNIESRYSLDDFIDIVTGKWDYLNILHKIRLLQ